MSQLAVFMNAGYVKTPDNLLTSIAAQVQPSCNPNATLLDMFCGEGIAAAEIARQPPAVGSVVSSMRMRSMAWLDRTESSTCAFITHLIWNILVGIEAGTNALSTPRRWRSRRISDPRAC